ncbi:transcriptional regulator with XRE-family HTH domain [Endobacter medicaginis]|uniref:Helix-turn-helix transcriptional regulator n=1 Tax=Endobacter medicaginis TaxID=1181271 RepID=A0A839V304_9PROT|nr:helix-turn-helix transcriptional regulator [Endobacter medicaginis]MBB3175245.1 transcriptional regulator with XRE-family HTH domain [Endobacter medicaginis]MCX5476271.1 helix-turn-helix transcriptional regulator [Endobacter medicaginis]NVN28971.1 helix-turn-helix transcriptional regulator [Endobacter medicaginis]
MAFAKHQGVSKEAVWLGENVRYLRRHVIGLSIVKFCEKYKLGYSFIARLETGKTDVSIDYAAHLAAVLGEPLADLLRPPATLRATRPAKFVSYEQNASAAS